MSHGFYTNLFEIERELMKYTDEPSIIGCMQDEDLRDAYNEVLFYKYTPLDVNVSMGSLTFE